jgi:hypothetical protein
MKFWLIVYLFGVDGEFMAKDIYETASEQQCVEFAGKVAQTIVNTQIQAQFHCLSDEEYRQAIGIDQ